MTLAGALAPSRRVPMSPHAWPCAYCLGPLTNPCFWTTRENFVSFWPSGEIHVPYLLQPWLRPGSCGTDSCLVALLCGHPWTGTMMPPWKNALQNVLPSPSLSLLPGYSVLCHIVKDFEKLQPLKTNKIYWGPGNLDWLLANHNWKAVIFHT